MTPGCLLDITGVISPCWTRQGLSSHAFLWHFSSLSRLRDSVTLGLETVGTVYCALHQYNAGPAERVENLTLACARTHQPHWPLGETDRHHKPQSWQIVTWRIQKTGVCCEKLCPHQLYSTLKTFHSTTGFVWNKPTGSVCCTNGCSTRLCSTLRYACNAYIGAVLVLNIAWFTWSVYVY